VQILRSPETPGVTGKPWGIPAIMAGLALPLVLWASSLAIGITEDDAPEYTTAEIVQGIILTILVLDGVFIAAPAFFALRRYSLGWAGLGLKSFDMQKFWMSVIAAAAAHIWVIIYGLLVLLIFGEGAVPEQDTEDLFGSRAVLPLVGIATVLVAPFAEEVFFRGFVFPGLIRPVGAFGAMLASAALFAMVHVTGPDSAGLVIPFLPIGFMFAWLYYKTGTLWTAISSHFVFNLASFALLASTAFISL